MSVHASSNRDEERGAGVVQSILKDLGLILYVFLFVD